MSVARDRLRVAFAARIASMLVEADGQVHDDERALLEEFFPTHLLRQLGLDDPSERRRLHARACEELAPLLDEPA